MTDLKKRLEEAVWIAHSLFERGKVSGSSANLSFLHKDKLYISGTGTCFGTLEEDDFAIMTMEGKYECGRQPSKEFPLHLDLYRNNRNISAVIHTHSTYATLWSMLPHPNTADVLPAYTPYLKMKAGAIALVPYAPPGSEQLFELFRRALRDCKGYLLANHGPVMGGNDLMDAFFCLEELEENARIAWELRADPDRGSYLI